MIRAICLLMALGTPLAAQTNPPVFQGETFTLTPQLETEILTEDGAVLGLNNSNEVEEVQQDEVAQASGAFLRMLDKVDGSVTDLEFDAGEQRDIGRLTVRLSECRYPKENPSGDAYGHLVIWPAEDPRPAFQGWMVASSPALHALDHPRYDVWLLRCRTS